MPSRKVRRSANRVKPNRTSRRSVSARRSNRRNTPIARRGAKQVYSGECPSGMMRDVNGNCVSSNAASRRRGAKQTFMNRSCPQGMQLDARGRCMDPSQSRFTPYGNVSNQGGFRKRGKKIATKRDVGSLRLKRTMFGSEIK